MERRKTLLLLLVSVLEQMTSRGGVSVTAMLTEAETETTEETAISIKPILGIGF